MSREPFASETKTSVVPFTVDDPDLSRGQQPRLLRRVASVKHDAPPVGRPRRHRIDPRISGDLVKVRDRLSRSRLLAVLARYRDAGGERHRDDEDRQRLHDGRGFYWPTATA